MYALENAQAEKPPDQEMHIDAVEVENLRGYSHCAMDLSRPRTVLVGPNNAGKTSILRMVNWLVNEVPKSLLDGTHDLPVDVIDFLVPARTTRHRARRLTLWVRVIDGRSHRRFRCFNGIAQLRLNLRQTPNWKCYLALGAPTRGETAESNVRALELLERLREESTFVYVPSFRDGNSLRFRRTLLEAFQSRLAERALHASQRNPRSEYRRVKQALKEVRLVATELASPLWEDMKRYLPPGLARVGKVTLETSPQDLVEWLSTRLQLKISTGEHDHSTVPIADLGSGLQSLLDLAASRSAIGSNTSHTTIIIEEPESFLHPSAQRTLARSLLGSTDSIRVIVTTHSPTVVEEAAYRDVVLCRDQRFFEPRPAENQTREEINGAFLTGYGAEMLFARSVLLVEGESDRLFFERLRRRLARADATGRIDELFVVPVGGKYRFAPWIRLVEAFATDGERPIRWLVVADGDAASQVRRAFSDAGVPVSAEVIQALSRAGSESKNGVDRWRAALRALNRECNTAGVPFRLLPVDVEDAALREVNESTVSAIGEQLGTGSSREEILSFLGSKAVPQGEDGVKQAWIRGYIADVLSPEEIGEDIRSILVTWLEGVMSKRDAMALMRTFLQADT